jgi:hypothetical protein
MRSLVSVLVFVALVGCDTLPTLPSFPSLGSANADGIRQFSVLRGAFNVVGPRGYCIDTKASKPRTGFALLASCAEISDATDAPAATAIMTAQVGEEASAGVRGAETEMIALFESAQGNSLLSASGDPADIRVVGTQAGVGVVFVNVEDSVRSPLGDISTRHWRAFVDVGDRLVLLKALSLSVAPVSDAQGLALLQEMVPRLRAANEISTN